MNFFSEDSRIRQVLKINYSGGKVFEIAAGRSEYRDLFQTYIGSDLLSHPYRGQGRLDIYCDARFLPITRNSIDFSFVVGALYQIPNPERVLASLFSILKPHGTLMVFDYTKEALENQYENYLKVATTMKNFAFWDQAELERLIRYAGFTNIKSLPSTPLIQRFFKKLQGKKSRWQIFRAEKKSY